MGILPKEFWDAVLNGIYPSYHEGVLAFNIEDYASLIEGYSYARSLYNTNWKFYVNILAIKDMAFLSFHSNSRPEKIDAVIEYNPTRIKEGRDVCDMTYLSLRTEKDPTFYQVPQKMKIEFFNALGVELLERPRKGAKVPFLKLINIITCSAKWKELMDSEPDLPPEEKANKIASFTLLELEPVSVASYASYSSDHEICSEANHAFSVLKGQLHDITAKWRNLIDKEPNLTPVERAEKLSSLEGMNLTPTTIANYARFSTELRVKKEGSIAFNYLLMKEHDITGKWKDLIKKEPTMTPVERAQRIALEEDIDPITVARYGFSSDDKIVRSEARKASNILLESKHNITQKWRTTIKENPDLTPVERAIKIGFELDLNPITIAAYGRASSDPKVKSEAIVASKILYEKKLDISNKWQKIRKEKTELTPIEITSQIAEGLSLSPITIAGYGRSSNVDIVKSEANKSFYAFTKKTNK